MLLFGISQLKKVKQFVAKRNSIALKYNKLFSELLIQLPFLNKNYYCSYHLYIINLKTEKLTKSHEEIFIQLKKHGLGVNVHYMPIHLHPYYRKLGFKKNMFVNAENYSKKAISIPLYPSLSDRDLKKVVSIIKKIIS